MAVRVWGWEKAHAVLSWDGDGVQQHPARKRADCPAVSRHETQGGIDPAGAAHVGGFVALGRPSPLTQRTRKRSMEHSLELRWESTALQSRAASRWSHG